MTERKPGGESFESWVEHQIREAQERGAFDNLAGAGKPIPRDSALDGDDWWIRRKMASEGLKYPNRAADLKERIARACQDACSAPTDAEARVIVARMNGEIHSFRAAPPPGPPMILRLIDIDDILARRRERDLPT